MERKMKSVRHRCFIKAIRHAVSLTTVALVVFFTCFTCTFFYSDAAAESSAPSRTIDLVYDDSGSMIINENGDYVDTWCQAKYALEVFAAMLGENDTMNVFVMSEFEDSSTGKPKLTLKGSAGSKKNVSEVHNMITSDGNTPFNAVRAAENHLKEAKADEKWLVVLTDGEFEDGKMPQSEIDDFFSQKPEDMKVMYLGMGAAAGSISAKPDNDIYYEKAQNNSEILQKLTDIGKQVFNRDRLTISSGNSISFDIPMKELIVFAQGENVSIKGLKNKEGKTISSTGDPVTVKNSEKATSSNHFDEDKIIIDKSLKGSIATFATTLPEGTYTIEASGAKTIEVYYQPDVDIIASLRQGDEEVTNLSDLEAGEYTIDFSLVKGGTEEKIGDSKLLGKVDYEAYVTNNDVLHDKRYKSGDTIVIDEGPLSIDATAHYLGYHTVQTHLDYSIYKDKELGFTTFDDFIHTITSKGFSDDLPTKVAVTVNGKKPTEEQWNNMDIPKLKMKKKPGFSLGDFRIEKSDDLGIYNLYPSNPSGKLSGKTYQDVDLVLSYEGTVGNETWAGEDTVTVKIQDNRNWLSKHLRILIIGSILGALLALILGYIPGIKHYLPKKLKKRPMVTSKKIGSYERPPKPTNGDFQKNQLYTFLPYVAEKGVIRYVPKGIAGAPKLQVKGSKGRRMEITNVRDFAKKKNITFDGERADRLFEEPRNQKKFVASSGLTMTAEINGIKYTCSLNE